ncbi:winged helix-turn-helix transcriptional regulator [Streptomyces avicenniae]|uniref:winged helix-turn-helix transcriptional regulator n=1 Tax=Streptomyces avicenniae TaxID=500153 RepID=UPI00069BB101|nr:winged helix-turn-helix transcriptional regulator [Streptomyces avicenniae]
MPRRSYDQYCAIARTLDTVGDRWSLLIVRELLAGPLRYTDLFTDLPGISTDVLASRLRDLERDGVVSRRRLPPPGTGSAYELTERGGALLPVLGALAVWGGPSLGASAPTDAVRAHWFALPLLARLAPLAGDERGVMDVTLPDGTFHLRLGDAPPGTPVCGRGPSPTGSDASLTLDTATCLSLADGTLTATDALTAGTLTVTGEGPLAESLRKHATTATAVRN